MQATPLRTEHAFNADLIRCLASFGVILAHASAATFGKTSLIDLQPWMTANIYDSIARVSVPLFVMVSGVFLLSPSKVEEPIKVFFKKRFLRVGIPFFIWSAVYFAWSYFVLHITLTSGFIIQGLLTEPYFHFWFIYMLIGLYLFTPLLRVLVAQAKKSTVTYMAVLAIFGSSVLPLGSLISGYSFSSALFFPSGWIGYYLLGYLLKDAQPHSPLPIAGFAAGTSATIIGTCLLSITAGHLDQFFYLYTSLPVAVASISAFLLLKRVQLKSSSINRVLVAIGGITLSIYMLHPLILELLRSGLLDFTMSSTQMNPLWGIPLTTAIVFALTVGVVLPLKKIAGKKLRGLF